MLDLALGDQVLDGTGDVFDRHGAIDAMLVEQVDAVGLQALERSLRHRLDALGTAVGAAPARARLQVDVEAELGGDDDLIADRLESFADQLLVRERTVGLGGVEECDAAIMRVVDELDHLGLVRRRTIDARHAHAAQAKG